MSPFLKILKTKLIFTFSFEKLMLNIVIDVRLIVIYLLPLKNRFIVIFFLNY